MRVSSSTNSYSTSSLSISSSLIALDDFDLALPPLPAISDLPSCFEADDFFDSMRCACASSLLIALAAMKRLHMTSNLRSLVSRPTSRTMSLNSVIVISTASSAVVEPPTDLE